MATRRSLIALFRVIVSLATACLALFLFWLGPTFGLGPVFYILASSILVLFLGAGWFPYTDGLSARIHQFSAWGVAYLTLPFAVDIAIETFGDVNILVGALQVAYIAYAIFVLAIHKLRPNIFSRHALAFQSTYIAGIFITLLLLAYV
ncbi:MAG: hypothetical protein LBL84_02180 [Candidatus Nomurabacteria bacterium]|nr:hypothetical protein [Candidatus Nomurabacteria bacterium]